MSGALTLEIQGTRPDLDELYEDLGGQRLRVFRARVASNSPDALPPEEFDDRGNPVTPAAPDPTSDVPGAGEELAEVACFAYQLSAQQRAELGAELGVPMWKIIAHWSAPLHTPGLVLEVSGGELPGPMLLVPLGDVPDVGTQRLAWIFLARAPDGLRG